MRSEPRQNIARFHLVNGVDIGVQKADRDARNLRLLQSACDLRKYTLVERFDDVAAGAQSLWHRQSQIAWHERRKPLHPDVILLEPVFVGHLHGVTETFGHKEGSLRALTLDDRIRRERRAVHDHGDVARLQARGGEDLACALQHSQLRCLWRSQELVSPMLAAALEGEVGEGAANVDGEAGCHAACAPLPARPLGWAKKLSFTELSSKRGSWDGIA